MDFDEGFDPGWEDTTPDYELFERNQLDLDNEWDYGMELEYPEQEDYEPNPYDGTYSEE